MNHKLVCSIAVLVAALLSSISVASAQPPQEEFANPKVKLFIPYTEYSQEDN